MCVSYAQKMKRMHRFLAKRVLGMQEKSSKLPVIGKGQLEK